MCLYFYNELEKKLKSNYQIKKAINEEKYFKIDTNLYSDKKYVNSLEIINKKYPEGIITMDSAFYYYNLTDVVPDYYYLATKRNNTRIKDNNIKQVFIQNDLFDFGKTEIIIENVKINIYDKERMLIELVRKRNSVAFDYYKEIIENYREIKDTLSTKKIAEYISNFSIENHLYDVIMKEVF